MAFTNEGLFGDSMPNIEQRATSFDINSSQSQRAHLGLMDDTKARDIQLAWSIDLGKIQVVHERNIHITPPSVQLNTMELLELTQRDGLGSLAHYVQKFNAKLTFIPFEEGFTRISTLQENALGVINPNCSLQIISCVWWNLYIFYKHNFQGSTLHNNNEFKLSIIPSNILSLLFTVIINKYLMLIVLDC